MAAIKKRKTRLLLAAMDAFADLKSESVEQTRSKKYDDPAHLKTRRRADGRSLTFSPVTARGSCHRVPCRCQPATGRRKWGGYSVDYSTRLSTVVGLHDIAGDVYHQSIITFPAPVSGIDIHIGLEHRCFSLETSEHRYHIGRFSRIGRTLVNWSANAQHSGCSHYSF